MTQQYFSKTFNEVSIYWRIADFNDGFEVKVFLSGDELCSGLLHNDNNQIPFRAKPGYRGPYYLLRGRFKFQHDTEGNPVLSLDIICEPSINQTDYILYPTDAKYPIDIIESKASSKPIDLSQSEEPNEPPQPIDIIEPEEPSQPIEPIHIDNPVYEEKPVHIVNPVPETLPETVLVNSGEQQDLFPFVYLHTWSEIKPDELQKRFVKYDPTKVPDKIKYGKDGKAGYLYEELVKLDNNARSDIENEANNFIKGGTAKSGKSYQGQFLQSVNDLPGYIKFFALLYTWLRHQRCIDLATIKFHIKKVLHISSWHDIKEYVKGHSRHLPELIGEKITDNTEGAITDYMIAKDRVWQNYFALTIIPEYRPRLLEELTKTLVMCHLIEKIAEDDEHCHPGSRIITTEEILEAAKATIVLPKDIFPLPPASQGESPSESKPAGWIEPYAIGDLQLVRQRLLRYELGEVAHIENVLKGERKETTQRKLNRVNESVTNASEQLEEIDTDIQGTRADLLTETRKTLAQDKITTTFNDLKATYGSPTIVTYTGSWSVGNAPASENPYLENVTNFAKKITTSTANRIARYVSQVRTFSTLNEAEEIVIHAFDNTEITSNVIGIYRWVNKIYRVHVVNYGHRLMIQFLLPNPAQSYIRNLFQLKGISLEPPISPDKLNLKSYSDVKRKDYAQLATIYDIQPPPIEVKIIPIAFKDGEPINLKKIPIPEGYKADSACVAGVFSNDAELKGFVGKETFTLNASTRQLDSLTMNQEDSAIAVSVMCNSEETNKKYCVTIEVKCTLTSEKNEEWQIKTYNAIQEGYRQQKAEYYERAGVEKTEIGSHNPLENRQIENNELKKGCTKQLLQQHLQLVGTSENNAIAQLRYIQFFEQAFEWDEMTYQFSPPLQEQVSPEEFTVTALNYYSGTDSIFTNFLQAESARVLLPVRPNYTMLVLYYLSSGMIWSGENSLTPTNEKYVSVVNELKTLPKLDCECKYVSKPWEITIPTSMIMLQDSSKLPQFPVVL
ncbi:hypothetical protein [Microcoleus sp. F4-D5]|uniref:hypothetical protein n=1 Tax=Microcoleus sp. F4-D5 TaxID=2818760 RepID=UPI002FD0048B